jgi:glycosyltransferase involved in cell wall biosynthesis
MKKLGHFFVVWIYVLFGVGISMAFQEQKRFVIVTASYNNKEWYQRNLESIFSQKYENYRVIYTNDCSSDGTDKMVMDFIRKRNLWNKITFISNNVRSGHLFNQCRAISLCDNDEIVVIVDGDDWLAHDGVLAYLNQVYQDLDVWMTYGQYWYWKKNFRGICRPIPEDIMKHNSIRQYPNWILSHLRTFYAGLFKMIKKEDLFYDGEYFPMCADVATMIPMAEMAGRHIRFIPEILLTYNDGNSLNFYHEKREEQVRLQKEISRRNVYERLQSPVFLKEQ